MKKKVLIAMDSFKGTFSSFDINNLVKKELVDKYNNIDVDCINIADGGEGSVDALIGAINGEIKHVSVMGPYKEKVDSYLGMGTLCGKRIAIIEVASVVGFQYKKEDNDPGRVYTNGIGELIEFAIDDGAEDIYICLGGSISNDAGSGIACALGVKFLDEAKHEFLPTGKTLKDIKYIDISNINKKLSKVNLYCLCDVTNPLYGPKGASYVFAKQKGAKDEELEELDENLKYYHSLCVKELGVNPNADKVNGTGAAGGICYSLYALLGAKILSGIKTILKLNNIEEKIKNCDFVITGEGKLDSQSFDGKVISEVSNLANKYNKKLIGIFGCSEIKEYPGMDIIPLFCIDEKCKDKNYLINNTPKRVSEKIRDYKLI